MRTFPAVTELVPHEAPMLALDRLVAFEEGRATAELTVRGDGLFVRDGAVDSVVALEWMAQTVAACLGMEAFVGGAGVRVGMVIACRQMKVLRPRVAVGERLVITALRVRGTDSLSHFDAEVRDGRGEPIATSTLTLVHGEAPPT
ncbi:MAG: 3-hydroxylacyl-ACP dehydratase [Planctomycetota bacterium]